MTVRQPRWTADDRAWVLAWLAEKSERCDGCGNPLDECMDPASARTWTVSRHVCQACVVQQAEQDNDAERERNSGSRQRGMKYSVSRSA